MKGSVADPFISEYHDYTSYAEFEIGDPDIVAMPLVPNPITDPDGSAATPGYQYNFTVANSGMSSVTLSQKLVQQIGMLSNCNVDLQQFVNDLTGYSMAYRMRCSFCGSTQPLQINELSGDESKVIQGISVFCGNHRHDNLGTAYKQPLTPTVAVTTTVEKIEIVKPRKYRTE